MSQINLRIQRFCVADFFTTFTSWRATLILLAMVLIAMPAQAERFFVDAGASGPGSGFSWEDAFVDLQPALDIAATGDEIWVACDTYAPTERFDSSNPLTARFVVRSGVSMFGGFSGGEETLEDRVSDPLTNGCVLGAPNSQDGLLRIMAINNIPDPVVIDGFAFLGSTSQVEFPNQGGGLIVRDSTFTGRNLAFADLATVTNGPGFGGALFSDTSTVELTNVTITRAKSGRGGGIAAESGSLTAKELVIIDSFGGFGGAGAVFTRFGTTVTIEDSWFENNVGNNNAGAIAKELGDLTVRRSIFLNNRVRKAGAISASSSGRLIVENSEFIGNRADSAGAIQVSGTSDAVITNSNIVGNQAGTGSGILSTGSGEIEIQNTIVFGNIKPSGNSTDQIEITGSATVTVNHSIVEGGFVGDGNVSSDPLFVRTPDPGDGNWATAEDNDFGNTNLTRASPAIDAGNNLAELDGAGPGEETAVELLLDLRGGQRRIDIESVADTGTGGAPIIDIGATEFSTKIFRDGFEDSNELSRR